MKVRATKTGYHNHIRVKEGTVFLLKDRKGVDKSGKELIFPAALQFSVQWMEKVEDDEVAHQPKNSRRKTPTEVDEDVI